MQCPDCGKLRHEGECEAPGELEMLAADAEQAEQRYMNALREKFNERAS